MFMLSHATHLTSKFAFPFLKTLRSVPIRQSKRIPTQKTANEVATKDKMDTCFSAAAVAAARELTPEAAEPLPPVTGGAPDDVDDDDGAAAADGNGFERAAWRSRAFLRFT